MPESNRDQFGRTSKDAIDPEIINPEDGGSQRRGGYYGGQPFGQSFYIQNFNNSGCLAASITFGLFIICLGQFGLLAAIGFFVFHIIGSIFTSVSATRALMSGRPFSLWTGRVANWIISFLLVAWLAGGIG